jgi:hypothetical protein
MKDSTKLSNWKLPKWKKELNKVFSIYIRTRDNFTCFTCDKVGQRNNIDNGHYIPRGACKLPLYFSEDNCHAQCTYCNQALEGNTKVYRERLGEEMHDKLYEQHYKQVPVKWYAQEYLDKIKYYQDKIEHIKE